MGANHVFSCAVADATDNWDEAVPPPMAAAPVVAGAPPATGWE